MKPMFQHDLLSYYKPQLAKLQEHMQVGLKNWPWPERDPMRRLVEGHLTRVGKRLRPLFVMLCTDLLGGSADRALPIAAAIELYHSASLVLDDVQDNTAFRGGASTVHVSENVSNAINFAGIVRSLSYYPVHEAGSLTADVKLALHRRLDLMATLVPLGQSLDIGWHQGWYDGDLAGFPYYDMVRLKTGAPFSCAAASAALLAEADPEVLLRMTDFGFEMGILYQLVDDCIDMFSETVNGVPEDLRSGKPARPIGILLEQLSTEVQLRDRVLESLGRRDGTVDRRWLMVLMRERGVRAALKSELMGTAVRLRSAVELLAIDNMSADRMEKFIQSCVDMAD